MSRSSVIQHALRGGLLVIAGSALIGVPFILGLDAAPLITGVLVGALTIGLGVAGTEPGTRGSLPLSSQAVYDRGLALGLIVSAVLFALFGEYEATALFAVAGVAALIMTSVTRYSAGTA
jgi:uncharacterized membrane protein YgaE (UPF0421/DUF939 family)